MVWIVQSTTARKYNNGNEFFVDMFVYIPYLSSVFLCALKRQGAGVPAGGALLVFLPYTLLIKKQLNKDNKCDVVFWFFFQKQNKKESTSTTQKPEPLSEYINWCYKYSALTTFSLVSSSSSLCIFSCLK